MTQTIRVGVHGGLVQWVEGVPEGVEVQVLDYDTDGVDDGLLSADGAGNPCVVAIYAGEESEPEMLRQASGLACAESETR